VTSSEIGRATAAGENYACDIFRAKLQVALDGRRSTLSLIVKSVRVKGVLAKVNILFHLMLHVRDIRSVLNSSKLSIILLHMYNAHTFIYVLQIRISLRDLIFLYAV
jgi:hypothetical protein